MPTNSQWCIPIPAIRILSFSWFWLNTNFFATLSVETHKYSILRLRVNNIRIFRINLRFKSITSMCYKPIGIGDAVGGCNTRRSSETEIILCSSIDVIKRRIIVNSHFIKLRYRKVLFEIPSFSSIKSFINTTITTYQPMLVIMRIDPHTVIIDMLKIFSNIFKGFSSIMTHRHPGVHGIECILINWICNNFLIVIATCDMRATFFPTSSTIG